ncbi:hypothetical protein ANN_06432 [Periplaneta americana]|uniref:Uncharacterized protein n=1 Tax=Periplaneta americana TaxID=6978 RepID=A0ABQ8TET0_PERAM|nr:hypothetical protein ANN_06432 [Periplaneta americana]
MYAAAGGLSLARRQARRQQRQQAAENQRPTYKPPSTPLPPIRHQHQHQHQHQQSHHLSPQDHQNHDELLQMSRDVQSQLLEPPAYGELNGRITSFGSTDLSPENKFRSLYRNVGSAGNLLLLMMNVGIHDFASCTISTSKLRLRCSREFYYHRFDCLLFNTARYGPVTSGQRITSTIDIALPAEQTNGITVFRISTMTSLMLHRCRTGSISLQRVADLIDLREVPLIHVGSNLLRTNLSITCLQELTNASFESHNRDAFKVVVITEDVQNVHLLLEYRPHIDVSLTCEHDPKLQEYCVCPQNMPQFNSEGIPNQAPETNKPMILNGPTSRKREGSDQVSVEAKQLGHLYLSIDQETFDSSTGEPYD